MTLEGIINECMNEWMILEKCAQCIQMPAENRNRYGFNVCRRWQGGHTFDQGGKPNSWHTWPSQQQVHKHLMDATVYVSRIVWKLLAKYSMHATTPSHMKAAMHGLNSLQTTRAAERRSLENVLRDIRQVWNRWNASVLAQQAYTYHRQRQAIRQLLSVTRASSFARRCIGAYIFGASIVWLTRRRRRREVNDRPFVYR